MSQNIPPKLNPCPFCKSRDVDPKGWMNGRGETGPACNDCGGSAQSVELWNAAAVLAAEGVVGWRDLELGEQIMAGDRCLGANGNWFTISHEHLAFEDKVTGATRIIQRSVTHPAPAALPAGWQIESYDGLITLDAPDGGGAMFAPSEQQARLALVREFLIALMQGKDRTVPTGADHE